MVFPQILGVVQPGVGSAPGQQLVMGPLLGNAAVLDHQDAVGGPDGGEPVGDDQGGAAPAQLVEGMLDPGFRDAVQGGGGLVQNEDGRIFRKIRAMATRCFWPPDSRVPRSPT